MPPQATVPRLQSDCISRRAFGRGAYDQNIKPALGCAGFMLILKRSVVHQARSEGACEDGAVSISVSINADIISARLRVADLR